MSYNIESDWYGDSRELEHERDEIEYRGAIMEDRLTSRLDEAELHAQMAEKEASLWRNRAEKAEANLAGYMEYKRRVPTGAGAQDEVHCGCVPVLRRRISVAEAFVERLIDAGMYMVGDCEASWYASHIPVCTPADNWRAIVSEYRATVSKKENGRGVE